MRLLVWLFRAFIFFTLFAFALNNQQAATVRWFFGLESRTPMVIVVLTSFAAGCAIGVLAMLPSWWKHRRTARRAVPGVTATGATASATVPGGTGHGDGTHSRPGNGMNGNSNSNSNTNGALPSDFGAEHPTRVGL